MVQISLSILMERVVEASHALRFDMIMLTRDSRVRMSWNSTDSSGRSMRFRLPGRQSFRTSSAPSSGENGSVPELRRSEQSWRLKIGTVELSATISVSATDEEKKDSRSSRREVELSSRSRSRPWEATAHECPADRDEDVVAEAKDGATEAASEGEAVVVEEPSAEADLRAVARVFTCSSVK